ncbi:hypothetical protein GXW74_14565 [Roseomonas eburnea]|uniref:PqqD family protein n=1 Tax=Neoroseomonas eburnea TaxID=1346889 RepID=A0A9X9XDC8_9PROT|nr:hypothetical protein [Neoroseomonas eburnea]MBR0681714.1 hypothetical protein [Neoroseomonas eburnea]
MTVSISVFCPTDCFRLEPGVRLRPVPELGHCLAYTPARPALHRLNPSAWLLAELADGRPLAAIAADFGEAMAEIGGEAKLSDVEAALVGLIELGIVGKLATPATEGSQNA